MHLHRYIIKSCIFISLRRQRNARSQSDLLNSDRVRMSIWPTPVELRKTCERLDGS